MCGGSGGRVSQEAMAASGRTSLVQKDTSTLPAQYTRRALLGNGYLAASCRSDPLYRGRRQGLPVPVTGPAALRIAGYRLRRIFRWSLQGCGVVRSGQRGAPCPGFARQVGVDRGDLQPLWKKMRVKTGKRQAVACILILLQHDAVARCVCAWASLPPNLSAWTMSGPDGWIWPKNPCALILPRR